MERNFFLKRTVGIIGAVGILPVINACKKETTTGGSGSGSGGSCVITREEVEGPYPYPGGELTNPLNRADVTGDKREFLSLLLLLLLIQIIIVL